MAWSESENQCSESEITIGARNTSVLANAYAISLRPFSLVHWGRRGAYPRSSMCSCEANMSPMKLK